MNNMKRVAVGLALAGATFVLSGTNAVADPDPGTGEELTQTTGAIDAVGVLGNGNANEDNSQNDNVSAGSNQQFSGDGNSNTVTGTFGGQSVDQSIHG
ncbi:hypothetical protein O1Q96_01680 (plasmid) [Streptomyces sp. Qhu-G9]|uniref:hypothetical protein n=1 Tax=Streptomyces sp. Qhu-G9 TaxID=3452799 RepID=UPI0022ABD6E1|nr:hypothetical protein [Streptomyces aurantiacus]WAU78557.1 hypothetical protein O1Q96_01665 [Streptomyces aurantiacus]WAU78558.1 hypothetical protein O1Q96_01670 [Streptomyces aurantiacus]WAU78559.1 hypothetical protein O1Q96_01675 [Streptomyces aurantiacus]WAU78560.1 hypothetical protein O1Q96_01680 [Streptomyces aurantiacus]